LFRGGPFFISPHFDLPQSLAPPVPTLLLLFFDVTGKPPRRPTWSRILVFPSAFFLFAPTPYLFLIRLPILFSHLEFSLLCAIVPWIKKSSSSSFVFFMRSLLLTFCGFISTPRYCSVLFCTSPSGSPQEAESALSTMVQSAILLSPPTFLIRLPVLPKDPPRHPFPPFFFLLSPGLVPPPISSLLKSLPTL